MSIGEPPSADLPRRGMAARRDKLLRTALICLILALPVTSAVATDFRTAVLDSANIIRRLPIPSGYVVTEMDALRAGLSLLLRSEDSSVAIVYNTAGQTIFRLAAPDGGTPEDPNRPGIAGLRVSENGQCLVICRPTGQEWANYEVYRVDGTPMFRLGTDADLVPSRTARYFCYQSNGMYDGSPRIVDSTGLQDVLTLAVPGQWKCAFFRDEGIVIASQDSVWFYDLPSGARRWAAESGLTAGGHPMIRTSTRESSFVVFDQGTITVIDVTGRTRWTKKFTGQYVLDVTCDDAAGRLAARVYDPRNRDGGQCLMMSSANGIVFAVSLPSADLASTTARDFSTMWVRDGVVLQWIPLNAPLSEFQSDVVYQTLVVDLSIPGPSPGQPVPGILVPYLASPASAHQYVRLAPDRRSAEIITVPTER